jgi:hypothetical protein
MRNFLTIGLVVAAVLAFELSVFGQGCSMCRTALESSPEGKVLASSFAKGILMILALPYALVGLFGVAIYRAFRKQSKMNS